MKRPKGLPASPGIYKIECDVTSKAYIGQATSLRANASNHLYKLNLGIDYNPPLQAAYNKYGANNFTYSLLELCAEADLTAREQWHMDAVPKGKLFNTKPAGPSGTLGLKQPEEQKLKHSRSKGGRPFYATHETTGEVHHFEHVGEACRKLPGLQRAHVYSVLHGTRTSHRGFTFDYDPSFPIPTHKHKAKRPLGGDHRSRALIGTCIETGMETTYDYVGAVKHAGFSTSAVYLCLAGGMQTHKGFRWRYADGLPHRTSTKTEHLKGARIKHGGSRAIVGVHRVTGEKVRFEYIRQAADALGVHPQNISAALKKGWATNGYVWTYE